MIIIYHTIMTSQHNNEDQSNFLPVLQPQQLLHHNQNQHNVYHVIRSPPVTTMSTLMNIPSLEFPQTQQPTPNIQKPAHLIT